MLVVISGTACSGKTTLAKALRDRGYRVVDESSGAYIEELKSADQDVGKLIKEDVKSFERVVFERQAKAEQEVAGSSEVVFLDRSLLDCLAFIEFMKMGIEREIQPHILFQAYSYIFMLDRVPFKDDGVRWEENESQVTEQEKALNKVYAAHGYKIIEVPVMPVKERVEFVLSRVGEYLKNENTSSRDDDSSASAAQLLAQRWSEGGVVDGREEVVYDDKDLTVEGFLDQSCTVEGGAHEIQGLPKGNSVPQ